MTGPQPPEGLPEVPWGKMAALAGGVAALGLAFKGAKAVAHVAVGEVRYRLLSGKLPARRG